MNMRRLWIFLSFLAIITLMPFIFPETFAQTFSFAALTATTLTASGQITSTAAGAASTPAFTMSGAPFTGGSGTTTFPLLYANSGASAPTSWNTSGTVFGVNAPSGFGGNFLDVHINGAASVGSLTFNGFHGQFNFTTLVNNSSGHTLISSTIPSITGAGCGGSSASISAANGSGSFNVNVGTSNTGTCTITMPTATTGSNCSASDSTTTSSTVFMTKLTGAPSTSSIVLQNFTSAGVSGAWTDSDILRVLCMAN